jgi:hypothetical protein
MIEPGTQEKLDSVLFESTKRCIKGWVGSLKSALDAGENELAFSYLSRSRGAFRLWMECTSPDGYEKYKDELERLLEPNL